MRREQSAKKKNHSFLPYRHLMIDLFKKKTRNKLVDKTTWRDEMSANRPTSISKSDSLFDIEKQIKKMTLSNRAFNNYMNKYTKLTQYFTFKVPSILFYPRKKNPKYLPIFYLQKIGYKKKNNDEPKDNNQEKVNDNHSNNALEYNYINNSSKKKENDSIQEKPYGFKYKDTKIVYDKNRLRLNTSFFKNNDLNYNITNINKF